MPTAITKIAPSWYVLEEERDKENPTRFKVEPLTSLQYLELTPEGRLDGNGNMILSGLGMRIALDYGLVDWENFNDAQGNAVPFVSGDQKFNYLSPNNLAELVGHIMEISSASDQEKKP